MKCGIFGCMTCYTLTSHLQASSLAYVCSFRLQPLRVSGEVGVPIAGLHFLIFPMIPSLWKGASAGVALRRASSALMLTTSAEFLQASISTFKVKRWTLGYIEDEARIIWKRFEC